MDSSFSRMAYNCRTGLGDTCQLFNLEAVGLSDLFLMICTLLRTSHTRSVDIFADWILVDGPVQFVTAVFLVRTNIFGSWEFSVIAGRPSKNFWWSDRPSKVVWLVYNSLLNSRGISDQIIFDIRGVSVRSVLNFFPVVEFFLQETCKYFWRRPTMCLVCVKYLRNN